MTSVQGSLAKILPGSKFGAGLGLLSAGGGAALLGQVERKSNFVSLLLMMVMGWGVVIVAHNLQIVCMFFSAV